MPTVTANDGDIKTWDDALKQEVWREPSSVAVGDTGSYKGESSPTATEFSYLHNVTAPIQTQLNAKAPLASPALTGTPTAPTAAAATNTTQIATTAFVRTEVANLVNGAPTALDTLNEFAAALGNDPSFATTTATALGNRLRVDTNAQGLNSTQQGNGRTNLGLGTSAVLNVPASGDAAAGEVVKGSDTRLTDARTPTAHAASHAAGGSDPLTLAQSQITNLVSDLAGKQPLDGTLTAFAGLTVAADVLPYGSGPDAFSVTPLTAFARTLLDDASQAAAQATLSLVPGVDVQAFDATLSSLAAFNSNGLLVQTAPDTFAARTLTQPSAGLTITNPAGTAGNPTFALADDLAALEALSSTGIAVRTGASAWAQRSLTQPAAGLTITNGDGVAGNPTFALANDLAAVEGLSSTGIAVRTGSDSWAQRSIAVPLAGLSIANADGSAGNPTLSLANDLAALEGLGSTGIAVRTAADTWLQRSVAAGTGISVSNGDGVSGNPTVTNTGVLSITGTANQVTASASTGAVTLSLPQNIHTGASPTFTGLTLSGNLTTAGVASSLIPSTTDTYDLGSSTKLWRKGWLSEMDAVLFAQNTITLVGGWLRATKNEGAIPAGQDVAAGNATIDFGQTMTVGDFVEFRAAGSVEYVQVGSLVSGTRYNVTRDLDGSGANAWPAGSVYAVNGQAGNGRIDINANSTPRISLIKQGATYNAQTELVRIGDLNGWGAYNAETYGFVAGEYGSTSAAWVSVDQSNGFRLGRNTATLWQVDTSGNVTMGQVATGSGNAFWNNSNNRLEFRGGAAGTVVQAYVDTTGAIVAGQGAVSLSSSGIDIGGGSNVWNFLSWSSGGGYIADIGTAYVAVNKQVTSTWGVYQKAADPTGFATASIQVNNDNSQVLQFKMESYGSAHATLAGKSHAAIFNAGGTFLGLCVGNAGTATAMLDVRGSAVITGGLTVDTATLVVDATNDRVGVGTASPQTRLEVRKDLAYTTEADITRIAVNNADATGLCAFSLYSGTSEKGRMQYNNNVLGPQNVFFTTIGAIPFYIGTNNAIRLTVLATGEIGVGTTSPTISGTGKFHMAGNTFRLETARTPASAAATGNAGEICWDASYFYVCVAANTWRRAAHATW
jgi:hypothetical protein